MKIVIDMPYIPNLSVNHYKWGYYTKPEIKTWMETLGWLVKDAYVKFKTPPLEEWKLPIGVRCDGVFKDKRSTPDLSNLSKVVLDAIADVSIDDKYMRWQDGDVSYGDDPRLTITISEAMIDEEDKS